MSSASSSDASTASAPEGTRLVGHRAQKRVITSGLNAERLRMLRAGLAAARARVAAGCTLWTRLQEGLELAEAEFAAENTLGLSPCDVNNAYPLAKKQKRRGRAVGEPDTNEAAQPTTTEAAAATEAAEPTSTTARLTKRQWRRMGAELVTARLRQVTQNAPRLASASLVLDFPSMQSFDLPASGPKTSVASEGIHTCPTSATLAKLRCITCGIRHVSRLGLLGTVTTYGCLCTPTSAVADPQRGMYTFDMTAYRCPLDAEVEFGNLKLLVKRYRGDGVSIVTTYNAFLQNRRLVEIRCHACQLVVSRPCNKRLIYGHLDCACRRPHAQPRGGTLAPRTV